MHESEIIVTLPVVKIEGIKCRMTVISDEKKIVANRCR